MHGPEWAWALLIAIFLGGLAFAVAVLLFLSWRIWRRQAAWWRWPALVAVALFLLGAGVSLGQIVADLIGG